MSEKKNVKATRQTRPAAGAPSGNPLDVALLRQIVELMAAHDVNTIDVREAGKRVIVKRGANLPPPTQYAAPMAAPAPAAGAPPAAASDPDAGLVPIKCMMVGTFYSKPNPNSKPYVTVGSAVDEETVVCSIEAMKHYNPIKAEMRGTIARMLVADGDVVDVGKPLFLVKPS